MVDPPLSPDDKPTAAELTALASRLLAELSRQDPRIAEKVRALGAGRPQPPRPRR